MQNYGNCNGPMNKKRIIIHINTEKSFRGGEIQTLYLIQELVKRGHKNFLVARPGSRILEEAQSSGIETFPLNMRGEWDLMSAKKMRRWMLDCHAEILHAHTAHACSIALLARRKDKLPPVVY